MDPSEHTLCEIEALNVIENTNLIQRHLQMKTTTEEEEKIETIRSYVSWLDCALAMIEDQDHLVEQHSDDIQKEALFCLESVHWPTTSIKILASIHSWIAKQYAENPLIVGLVNWIREHNFQPLECSAYGCAEPYQRNEVYQSFAFSLPIATSPTQPIEDGKITVVCHVSFNWLEPIEKKFWGKIKIEPSPLGSGKLSEKQEQEFFSKLIIDLCEGQEHFLKNGHCNDYGEFYITENQSQIQTSLQNRKLECTVHLAQSEYKKCN